MAQRLNGLLDVKVSPCLSYTQIPHGAPGYIVRIVAENRRTLSFVSTPTGFEADRNGGAQTSRFLGELALPDRLYSPYGAYVDDGAYATMSLKALVGEHVLARISWGASAL